MGREGPFFCHFSVLSGPGVSGWKGWRYSPRCAEDWFSEVGLLLYGVLRRLMCNELDQEIRQVGQRATKRVVDPLSAGVSRDLGRQASQQPLKSLRSVAFQREEVLELADHPFDDLAPARGPAPI